MSKDPCTAFLATRSLRSSVSGAQADWNRTSHVFLTKETTRRCQVPMEQILSVEMPCLESRKLAGSSLQDGSHSGIAPTCCRNVLIQAYRMSPFSCQSLVTRSQMLEYENFRESHRTAARASHRPQQHRLNSCHHQRPFDRSRIDTGSQFKVDQSPSASSCRRIQRL